MSKDLIRALEMGAVPWLRLDRGVVDEPSKKAVDETFLRLGGRVFFPFVEPMKSRSKAPRRGWSEFVSELVSVAQKAHGLAEIWHEGGGRSVELVSKAIRKIPGFGGKGFRMKAFASERKGTTATILIPGGPPAQFSRVVVQQPTL